MRVPFTQTDGRKVNAMGQTSSSEGTQVFAEIEAMGERARAASRKLANLSSTVKNAALNKMADHLEARFE